MNLKHQSEMLTGVAFGRKQDGMGALALPMRMPVLVYLGQRRMLGVGKSRDVFHTSSLPQT